MIAKRSRTRSVAHVAVLVLAVTGLSVVAARAQGAPRARVAPGEALTAQVLQSGGPAGKELAGLVGQRPVLGVYWRPGDARSEANLANAVAVAQSVAPAAQVFPLAAVPAGMPPAMVSERLRLLQLGEYPPRVDNGQLARLIGVQAAPAFFLVDAGGVLRLVGGANIGQAGAGGVSIADALALAGRGAPVPTLGVLGGDPVYRLIGQKLPEVPVDEIAGSAKRLGDFVGKGKRVLVFYWSPTCPHCTAAWPGLAEWYRSRRPADLVLVDIARADAPELKDLATKMVKAYPGTHLLDLDRKAATSLSIRETPTIFLVDRRGTVTAVHAGADVEWSSWVKGGGPDTTARSR